MWQATETAEPDPESGRRVSEPDVSEPGKPAPAGRGVAANRLSGKAKKEAAAAEKMRRNRRKQAPRLLVLAGLPGCGKSTFAKALEASDPKQWAHA